MLELLRDGAWQAIGAVFSITAIIVSFAIYRWQLQKAAFTYLVKSAYPLLKSTEELHGRLSVQVDGVAVRNIDVMFIEFQNSGNRPIARSDFDVPVSITFKPPVRIISAVVDTEAPKNLGVSLGVDEQQVTITPMLLNPSDGFTLKLLLSSDSLKYAVSGRIVGVKEISQMKPNYKFVWSAYIALAMIVFGTWLVLSTPLAHEQPVQPVQSLPTGFVYGLACFSFGLLLFMSTLIFKQLETRRRFRSSKRN